MTEREEFVLNQIIEDGGSSSWAWQHDKEFAQKFMPEHYPFFEALLKSEAPHPIQINMHSLYGQVVKRARLSALRNLVKKGKIYCGWTGTGEGGFNYLGVKRLRVYLPIISKQ